MKIILFRFMSIAAIVLSLIACTSYDHDKPDTLSNQKGFESHFGFAVPTSVSDLYYFADELGADVTYQLGFEANQETIDEIVSDLGLGQEELKTTWVGISYEFPWWDEEDIENLTPYWKSNQDKDYYWILWYDPTSQRVYYLEFSL